VARLPRLAALSEVGGQSGAMQYFIKHLVYTITGNGMVWIKNVKTIVICQVIQGDYCVSCEMGSSNQFRLKSPSHN
jgi:hypothetical protein